MIAAGSLRDATTAPGFQAERAGAGEPDDAADNTDGGVMLAVGVVGSIVWLASPGAFRLKAGSSRGITR